jgi:hypothetical protein
MDGYKRQRCGDLKMAKLLNPVYVPDEDMLRILHEGP